MPWGRAKPLRGEEQSAVSASVLAGSASLPAARQPSPAGQALIELCDVVKIFHNAAGEFAVLKGINAEFHQGEFVSIVGRSGSGKSTLLNMMTGIDHPTRGSVRIGDVYLHTLSEGRMSVWRGRSMGIVFQFFQLLPMLTLLENVMLPMDFCDMYAPAEGEGRALALLAMVGLHGLEYKYPAAVAGGQQQSAAVARALANDPPILVADEPTGNLDSRTAERILAIFEEQVANHKTVLLVTHDDTLASRAARKLVISDGELVNEYLVKALPNLAHDHLLKLTHMTAAARFAPGELLFAGNGTAAPALMVITAGQVEVLAGAGRGRPVRSRQGASENLPVSGRLMAGDIFTQSDLAASSERRGLFNRPRGAALRGLRVVDGPLEALVLDAAGLAAALNEMAGLREALEGLGRKRRWENGV